MNPQINAGTLASLPDNEEYYSQEYGVGVVYEIPYPRELSRGNYCWHMRNLNAICNGTSLMSISI